MPVTTKENTPLNGSLFVRLMMPAFVPKLVVAICTANVPELPGEIIVVMFVNRTKFVGSDGVPKNNGNPPAFVTAGGTTTYCHLHTSGPMLGGEPAWAGDESALAWQLVQADLSAYSGMTVNFRFGFQSDASGTHAGIYVDDFLVE